MIGITNIGGGGEPLKDTDAVLRVIAPAHSIVTISKGLISKSDSGHENGSDSSFYDYYFVIHANQFDAINPWTVTATNNGQTVSTTIVINSAKEYPLQLWHRFYVLQDGVWKNSVNMSKYQGNCTEVANTGNRIYKMTDNNWSTWFTASQINVTNYKKMVVVLTGGKTRYWDRFGLLSTKTSLGTQNANIFSVASVSTGANGSDTTISSTETLQTDITSITGSYWFGFTLEGTNNWNDGTYGKGGFKVTNMYFEV